MRKTANAIVGKNSSYPQDSLHKDTVSLSQSGRSPSRFATATGSVRLPRCEKAGSIAAKPLSAHEKHGKQLARNTGNLR
jgi:hypothetical protein